MNAFARSSSSAPGATPRTFSRSARPWFCRSMFLFVLFKSSNRVAEFFGSVRRNDFYAKHVISTLLITEDRFSFDRSSVCLPVFLRGFLKSSELVNKFFRNVSRNAFCAMLVVCSLLFTEDFVSLDGFSVLPVNFFTTFSRAGFRKACTCQQARRGREHTTLWPSDSRPLRTTQRTSSPWTSSSASLTSGLLLSPTSLGKTLLSLQAA